MAEERRKTIRILKSILGVTQSTDEEMASKDLAALEVMIDELRDRISSRLAGQ